MHKVLKDVVLLTALGTASYCAYSFMSPRSKREISRDMKETAKDMHHIKDGICDVGEDVCHMAESIKKSF